MDAAAPAFTSETKSSNPSRKLQTHILVFPIASPSHAIPLLSLTHRLLSLSDNRLTATILLTPANLPLAESILSSHHEHSIQTLVLTPPSPPSRPPLQRLPAFVHCYSALRDPILSWFQSHPNPPNLIISDFFLGWTEQFARELHIPRIAFCPSGAFGTAMYYSLWLDQPKNPDKDPNLPVRLNRIPGSPVFPWWQLSHVYTNQDIGDPVEIEFFRDSMVANLSSWATVFNTFDELESPYLDQLKKEVGHNRVWAVGPLLPKSESDGASSRSVEVEQAMEWLSGQPDSSVVYICFGSREELSREQAAALTEAIKKTKKARFLWCVGKSDGIDFHDSESEGDRDRVVVLRGWVPQLEILRNRAVGAFVTHCGWNSVLEAVANGVRMVAWPMGADQFADARLVVEASLGVQVRCAGPENVPEVGELARVLDDSVSGERRVDERVKWMKEKAAEAVMGGGSSERDLSELLRSLEELER